MLVTVQYFVASRIEGNIAKTFSEKPECHDFFSEKEVEINKQWHKQINHFAWKVEAEDRKKTVLVII